MSFAGASELHAGIPALIVTARNQWTSTSVWRLARAVCVLAHISDISAYAACEGVAGQVYGAIGEIHRSGNQWACFLLCWLTQQVCLARSMTESMRPWTKHWPLAKHTISGGLVFSACWSWCLLSWEAHLLYCARPLSRYIPAFFSRFHAWKMAARWKDSLKVRFCPGSNLGKAELARVPEQACMGTARGEPNDAGKLLSAVEGIQRRKKYLCREHGGEWQDGRECKGEGRGLAGALLPALLWAATCNLLQAVVLLLC